MTYTAVNPHACCNWPRLEDATQHVANAPKTVMGHGQVKDKAPAARCVLEVAVDLNVSTPLAYACCYAVLCPDRVSGRAEHRPQHAH